MKNDGRISEAPFVSPFYAPHSASLHVGFSTIYASPKRIRILRVWGGGALSAGLSGRFAVGLGHVELHFINRHDASPPGRFLYSPFFSLRAEARSYPQIRPLRGRHSINVFPSYAERFADSIFPRAHRARCGKWGWLMWPCGFAEAQPTGYCIATRSPRV